jgi:hypothetical protein
VSGDIEVAPRLEGNLVTFVRSYFFAKQQLQPVVISGRPLVFTVLPLPEAGRPDDFSGAVGQFSMTVSVDPTNVAAGDLINIRTVIAGTGDFDRVSAPVVRTSGDFKSYPPALAPDASGRDRKSFRQIVIPQSVEAAQIRSVRFSFYDPRAGCYRTLDVGPFPLIFHAETNPPSAGSGTELVKPALPGAAPLPRLPLKDTAGRWHRISTAPWYCSPLFLALNAVPMVALLAAFVIRRRPPSPPG